VGELVVELVLDRVVVVVLVVLEVVRVGVVGPDDVVDVAGLLEVVLGMGRVVGVVLPPLVLVVVAVGREVAVPVDALGGVWEILEGGVHRDGVGNAYASWVGAEMEFGSFSTRTLAPMLPIPSTITATVKPDRAVRWARRCGWLRFFAAEGWWSVMDSGISSGSTQRIASRRGQVHRARCL
jgi:hypothetical protein